MKKLISLLAALSLAASPLVAAEPTLAEVQQELALVKARLELADAKLALAKKTEELAKLGSGPSLGTTAVQEGTQVGKAKPTSRDEVLRAAGFKRLNSLPNLDRQAILGVNGVKSDTFAIATAKFGTLPTDQATALAKKRADEATLNPSGKPAGKLAASDPQSDIDKLNAVLVGLGAKETKKQVAVTGSDAVKDEEKASAVTEVKVKTAEDVALRDAGIAFSQGVGVAFGNKADGDASLGTLLVRWNWLQRSASGKWNRWLAHGTTDDSKAQIPFRGQIEYWLEAEERDKSGLRYTSAAPALRRARTLPEFTTFGPFFGTAIVGDKVTFGAKKERPYLVGLSGGWGLFQDAASVFSIDLGVTVSPTSGIDHSKFYAGVSFDGVVLGRILGFTRKGHLPLGEGK